MGSKVNSKHPDPANESGEKYLKGRTAGVEGTYGKSRKGTAEITVVADVMDQSDSGSVQSDLTSSAASIKSKALKNSGGNRDESNGDQAIAER